MKRDELLKQLRKIAKARGSEMTITEGGSHSKVFVGDRFVMVPRHREINERLAQAILRDAREG
jgi:hypothetical protein